MARSLALILISKTLVCVDLKHHYCCVLFSAGLIRNTNLPDADSMTDNEVQVEVQLLSNALSGQHDFRELMSKDSDCMETIQNTGQGTTQSPRTHP